MSNSIFHDSAIHLAKFHALQVECSNEKRVAKIVARRAIALGDCQVDLGQLASAAKSYRAAVFYSHLAVEFGSRKQAVQIEKVALAKLDGLPVINRGRMC